jgi:hypothetical protein
MHMINRSCFVKSRFAYQSPRRVVGGVVSRWASSVSAHLGNMAWVLKGMRAARKPGLTLAHYQESQIRHFNRTLNMYDHGKNGRAR